MKRNIAYTAAIILTVVNLAAFGTLLYNRWNSTESAYTPDQRDQRFEQMKRELALSGEQAADLNVYRTSFQTELDSLSGQLRDVRTKLARALWEQPLDTTGINSMLSDISRLQSTAQRLVISHLLTVKGMLSPEQQKRFYDIVLERFSSAADQPMPGRPSH